MVCVLRLSSGSRAKRHLKTENPTDQSYVDIADAALGPGQFVITR